MAILKKAALFAVLTSVASAIPNKRMENTLGVQYGIDATSMISYDSIYFGYAPNYNPEVNMADLNGATGQKGATYNVYSQITSKNVADSSCDGNEQYNVEDIISSGAVLIASLMPLVDWTDITADLCASVASYFEDTFTSQGVTVWLRFAHEVNYYASESSGEYPGGLNYDEYFTAWQNMYNAVSSNDRIFMYWSPNDDTESEPVAPWWPGKDYVDIVGMDYYPNADDGLPDFATAYGDFYDTYAAGYGIPFAIGETGTQLSDGSSASTAQKEEWLAAIINPSDGFGDYSEYYMSATWFEYGPPTNARDFYVVYGQTSAVVEETISNTESGSA